MLSPDERQLLADFVGNVYSSNFRTALTPEAGACISQLIEDFDEQAEALRKANEALAEARRFAYLVATYICPSIDDYETAKAFLQRHPTPTNPSEGD